MNPFEAMTDGKKANRELVDLFRSLPEGCYSIELMEKIISMPMWCVDNDEDNLDVAVALYEAYESENVLDDPAYFERIKGLFWRAVSLYTFGPKMDKMKLAAYEFFRRRCADDPENYVNPYMNFAIETMGLRNPNLNPREQWELILKEVREGYAVNPELYECWLGSALLRVADEDFVSDKTEDKERAVEEQMEGLEHLLEYHKTHYLENGSANLMDVSNSIVERLGELGKKEQVVHHYKMIAELTADADNIEIGTREMYVEMHADALRHLSNDLLRDK